MFPIHQISAEVFFDNLFLTRGFYAFLEILELENRIFGIVPPFAETQTPLLPNRP